MLVNILRAHIVLHLPDAAIGLALVILVQGGGTGAGGIGNDSGEPAAQGIIAMGAVQGNRLKVIEC